MSIISQTDQNTMELLAKVSSLEGQVVALQASEAKLTDERDSFRGVLVRIVDETAEMHAEIDHQLYSVRRDKDICGITGLEDISELEDLVGGLNAIYNEFLSGENDTTDDLHSWCNETSDENTALKGDIERLEGYLAEIGMDYDGRDEGSDSNQYRDWFNKQTNDEFL
tara:strand:+ start:767 stop:1270 length:504 start_codon:yes stop_codon:yes gene_type:complete